MVRDVISEPAATDKSDSNRFSQQRKEGEKAMIKHKDAVTA